MSASFYDLLKYAATGIAAPSMTYYDKMRASTLMGGVVQTLTGIPPLSFKSDGTPLISWSMKGNGSQSGTPTPDNPVTPEFVGVRTGNLFDKSTITTGHYADLSGINESSNYYCSDFIPITASTYYFQNVAGNMYQNSVVVYDFNKQGLRYEKLSGTDKTSGAMTFQSGDAYIRINCYHQTDVDTVMVNIGSTALPYEPYGYKISPTCAGQTTPVYLGQVSTVRRIKKLVLTGEEDWSSIDTSYGKCFKPYISTVFPINSSFCSHFKNSGYDGNSRSTARSSLSDGEFICVRTFSDMYFRKDSSTDTEAFKTYLQQQYTAGTPVTIWYVLATPTTGIVNEPLCKIGDYADELNSTDAAVTIPTVKGNNTLTVETDLQPSEMSITYKG